MTHRKHSIQRPTRHRVTWRGLSGLAGLALLAVPGSAQTTAADLSEDEPLIMSPFEVSAEQDTGYLASSVQSGTRLRSDLKDIASSISVVTKDFMDDIAATDLEGLLIYTLGTEVGGVQGNFTDAGVVDNPNGQEIDYDGAFSNSLPSTRVRGLTRADVARDFFITSAPPDGYNIERVEISRGANAMLFGLGSPSGIVNSSLIQANLNRRITELELQTDNHGSFRSTLDHNQVVIPGKLALRVAGLYEDEKYQVEEAWSKDRRYFFAGAWRPYRYTTIRANFEKGDIDSNRPEIRPPGDAITYWWDLGKPAYDPSSGNNGAGQLLGTVSEGWPNPVNANGNFNTNIITTQIGSIGGSQNQMLLVYNDPNSSQMSMGIPGRENIQGIRGGNWTNAHPNAAGTALTTDGFRGLRELNSIKNRVVFANDITRNYWKATQITDPAIFDFYNHMLHADDKREFSDWESFNITGEQLFLDGKAGIEVAYNHEELDNGSAMPLDSTISGYTLRIDVNTHLPDGTPNPNFGRPFTTAYSRSVVKNQERDVARATAFYDLDLRNAGPEWLGKFLGTHRFQAAHSRQEMSAFIEGGNFYFNNGIDYSNAVWGYARTASSAQRGASILRYLGPSLAGASSADALRGGIANTRVSQFPDNVESVKMIFFDPPATNNLADLAEATVRDFSLLSADLKDPSDVRRDNLRYTKEEVNSTVGILQSRWFEGNLVTTVGARRDHVITFDADRAALNPATGTAIVDESFYPKEVSNLTEDNVNWGAVLHTPAFIDRHLPFGTELSFFYNQAENFAPAGQRYDIYDNPLPHETGETEDYGIMISTFDGKLILRAAKYKTISGVSSTLGNLTTPLNNLADFIGDVQENVLRGRNVLDPIDEPDRVWDPAAAEAAWANWYNSPTGVALRNTFRVVEHPHATDPNLSVVDSDRRSGEVVAPSDVTSKGEEYEIIYNPTRNWRISFNAARAEAVRTNVATQLRDIVFNELVPLMAGPAGELESASGESENVASNRFLGQIYNQMLPRLSEEGLPTNELAEWRWNLATNYSFNDGMFKGFNVGLGLRWQDKKAIGFPIIDHPVFGPAPDVTNPYYTDDELNVDGWIGYRRKFEKFTWKIQLNVRNIGVGDELTPVAAQPDGSIAGWRIRARQSWTLRSTFSF